MKKIPCACGCGELRDERDKRGRPMRYIYGHQPKVKTAKQLAAASANMREAIAKRDKPWNKGKSYVFAKRVVYANKGSWTMALKRLYGDCCMNCGWSKAPCDSHHIEAKGNGGKHTIDNGVILCPNCHRLAAVHVISESDLRSIKDAAITIVSTVGFAN